MGTSTLNMLVMYWSDGCWSLMCLEDLRAAVKEATTLVTTPIVLLSVFGGLRLTAIVVI